MESIEDQLRSFTENAKITAFHLILLIDMCLFSSATLNAHLQFLASWDSGCDQDQVSMRAWSALGYTLRLVFTAFFLVSKIKNLYYFLKSKEKFPIIGAYYSPLMSTFLLIVIVYDFSSCRQLSEIFSIHSAERLVSWYTILVMVFMASLVILQVFIWATNRNKKNKFLTLLKVVLAILYIIGCLVGVLANFEMLKKGKISFFAAFDLYSFAICLGMTGMQVYSKCRNLHSNDAAISSLS